MTKSTEKQLRLTRFELMNHCISERRHGCFNTPSSWVVWGMASNARHSSLKVYKEGISSILPSVVLIYSRSS